MDATLWISCFTDGTFREIAERATKAANALDIVESLPGLTTYDENEGRFLDTGVCGSLEAVYLACKHLAQAGIVGLTVDVCDMENSLVDKIVSLGFAVAPKD